MLIPLLLTLLLGTIEFANYSLQSRRAHQAAVLAAVFLSRDGNMCCRSPERNIVEDIWMITNPTAHLARVPRDGQWANGLQPGLASVEFAADPLCTLPNCPLLPKPRWTFLYGDIITKPIYNALHRSTSGPTARCSTAQISMPALVGRAPVVIADLTYPYLPLVQGWFFSAARAARERGAQDAQWRPATI